MTILLAEDSSDDVFFFRRALEKAGVPAVLHVAENGREAIQYLKKEGRFADAANYPQPEIIFIDLKMPEVGGFEVLSWIAQKLPAPAFQMIVLTSSDEPPDYQKALELGAHAYFLKPISPDQLATIIRRLQTKESPPQPVQK